MILGPKDEAAFLAYCDASPDETIWLRWTWTQGGARFAAAERDGRLVALAAHDGKGIVQVHANQALAEVARACLQPDLPIVGVAGTPEHVAAAVAALGLGERKVARTSHEILMAVDTDALVPPDMLSQPGVVSRRAREDDLPLLVEWRKQYFREVHGSEPDEALIAEVREDQVDGRLWVLEDGGAVVNNACFSAVFPALVQIEYAYGPRELRAKKYGRSTVCGALLVARGEGIKRAVFNTDVNNVAVQTGIHPIGFRKTGDYWVVLFER